MEFLIGIPLLSSRSKDIALLDKITGCDRVVEETT
jgi:hypothetical protein